MRSATVLLAIAALAVGACAQTSTAQQKTELAQLAKEQKARDAVKARLLKSPKNAQLRQKFVLMNDKLAHDTMVCDAYTPHQKYAGALELYRYSLKWAPHDQEAHYWVNMIVSIYKQMHRPVPN